MVGLLMTRVLKKLNVPAVTAYLIAGLLIGPNCLGALTKIPGLGFHTFEEVESFGLISDVALGFIAFAIGNEFRLSALRKMAPWVRSRSWKSFSSPQPESRIRVAV